MGWERIYSKSMYHIYMYEYMYDMLLNFVKVGCKKNDKQDPHGWAGGGAFCVNGVSDFEAQDR